MLLSAGNKKHTMITLPFNVRHEREKTPHARLSVLPERTHILVTSAFIIALLKAHRHSYSLRTCWVALLYNV